jgi:cytochrome c biogenesis protein CcdA
VRRKGRLTRCHEDDTPELADEATAPPEGRDILFVGLLVALALTVAAASIGGYFLTQPTQEGILGAGEAHIYFNDACGPCAAYVAGPLSTALSEAGVSQVYEKDYINVRSYRGELRSLNEELDVPEGYQSHIAVFVRLNSTYVFEGHVSSAVITDLLTATGPVPEKILVIAPSTTDPAAQNVMDDPSTYEVWAFAGEAMEYPAATPIQTYLDYWQGTGNGVGPDTSERFLLPLVVVSGLLDGINPCAIAILLFFVALLFVIRRTRANTLKMGTVYIAAIFTVYFLIGIGILQTIFITGIPHFMARVGAFLVIGLGAITLLTYVFPDMPVLLKTPKVSWEKIKDRMLRGTYPSALVAGLLVGLCTFPCSGGIYVAILGLLASETAYTSGLGYLLLYNVMFVLPLVIILAGISNKTVARRLATWERSNNDLLRLVSGLVMISIGVIILVFFV